MSTSASNGGGNIITNTLGSLFGIGTSYDYGGGSWRSRFGDSLVTDTQRKIHAERAAEAALMQIKFERSHRAELRRNIAKATGQPALDPRVAADVNTQHAPKNNLLLQAGVPVKV